MKATIRQDKCLVAIGERPTDVTNDVFDDVPAAILEEENRRNNREDKHASSRLGGFGGDKRDVNRIWLYCIDYELKVIKIGSIMVKMHDGTFRTIRDVRHEGDPSTLQESLNNPYASFWKEAMQEEIIGEINSEDGSGAVIRARLVVKGYAREKESTSMKISPYGLNDNNSSGSGKVCYIRFTSRAARCEN
ncbi:hypothetical protein Tco_0950938 [Tanacetum coccineum]|uniref:Uncharacterized protein n=1 Tax=Tanacetum coccineum TaxID=301880 RepID=A0ABQ5DVG9_9ASTR